MSNTGRDCALLCAVIVLVWAGPVAARDCPESVACPETFVCVCNELGLVTDLSGPDHEVVFTYDDGSRNVRVAVAESYGDSYVCDVSYSDDPAEAHYLCTIDEEPVWSGHYFLDEEGRHTIGVRGPGEGWIPTTYCEFKPPCESPFFPWCEAQCSIERPEWYTPADDVLFLQVRADRSAIYGTRMQAFLARLDDEDCAPVVTGPAWRVAMVDCPEWMSLEDLESTLSHLPVSVSQVEPGRYALSLTDWFTLRVPFTQPTMFAKHVMSRPELAIADHTMFFPFGDFVSFWAVGLDAEQQRAAYLAMLQPVRLGFHRVHDANATFWGALTMDLPEAVQLRDGSLESADLASLHTLGETLESSGVVAEDAVVGYERILSPDRSTHVYRAVLLQGPPLFNASDLLHVEAVVDDFGAPAVQLVFTDSRELCQVTYDNLYEDFVLTVDGVIEHIYTVDEPICVGRLLLRTPSENLDQDSWQDVLVNRLRLAIDVPPFEVVDVWPESLRHTATPLPPFSLPTP